VKIGANTTVRSGDKDLIFTERTVVYAVSPVSAVSLRTGAVDLLAQYPKVKAPASVM
jgi:hypothetical protein